MPETLVVFPVELEPGVQLRIPAIRNLAIDFILVVLEPVTFESVDELYSVCQDPEQTTFKVQIRRKPS